MSIPSPYADGGNGTPAPQGPPNVYLPQTTPPPEYDEYVDPASAHGWQNAYDETRELPSVGERDASSVRGEDGPRPGVPGPREGGVAADGAGRSGRRGRRKAAARRSRRVVAVAGAVGAVSAAALIAGFAFSGSPSGVSGGKGGRTGPTAGEAGAEPGEPGVSSPAGEPSAPGAPSAGRGSPGTGVPDEGRKGEEDPSGGVSAEPSSGATSAPAGGPTVAPPVTTEPGDPGPSDSDDRPGRGQGPKRSR
ncbi:hypothetical protein [Streptomyces sp. NPDC014676]|uniref:hypothetical protein n=1 Tax=Streptomyces sp. NPDC014676 TaxID=3364879 RepID=UPI0036F68FB5